MNIMFIWSVINYTLSFINAPLKIYGIIEIIRNTVAYIKK